MASWKWITAAAAAALLPAPASAATSTASIFSVATVPDWQMSSELIFQITVPGVAVAPQRYAVVPLTAAMGLNQTAQLRRTIDIKADLAVATDTSYVNIGSGKIAYLSCDNTTDSFIDANTMFRTLMDQLPDAILLYSEVGNSCGVSSTDDLSYLNILTMADKSDATQTLNITQATTSTVRAEIGGNATGDNSDGNGGGGISNSTVAMSILYSITGLVTALFIVIIATGAVRAHRNPERYGPRNGNSGRPRQSRAKGIARAVLETLPIVKFGDPTPTKPDPTMELESAPDSHPVMTTARDAADVEAHPLSTTPEGAVSTPKAHDIPDVKAADATADAKPDATSKELVSGIGEASATPTGGDSSAADDADHLGCSICTEDFSVGEDVRVLPCDHKFHPHCVDPWLVNVSGTCPLCRLDLRPNNTEDEPPTTADGQHNMAPPLETDGSAETTAQRATAETAEAVEASAAAESTSRRRSSRLFDLHRLRHAPVEERIEALRQLRAENQAAPQQESPDSAPEAATGSDDEHSRAKLTKRLRDKFRIRTRTQSSDEPSGSN